MAPDMALNLALTHTALGCLAVGVFVLAYLLVMAEEVISLRKSKPVLIAAGLIWLIVSIAAKSQGQGPAVELAVKHYLTDYGELFLFLLVAMTYVNTIEERKIFHALRSWMLKKGFTYRQLFWLTGFFAFFLSPIADNMTTALVMGTVVMVIGKDSKKFTQLACINIVVAANAGGAFCPFGDVTTLMVWQTGVLHFGAFFRLFVPCLINFVLPACCLYFALPTSHPAGIHTEAAIKPAYGGYFIVGLFLATIASTVVFSHSYHLPPVIGMMFGLGYLKLYGFYLKQRARHLRKNGFPTEEFDIFKNIREVEWDTLLFFYGVILCVGGLGTLGYLESLSHYLYTDLGPTTANISLGLASAILDNIPLMFAVLNMAPSLSEGQWLLVTLTTGVGGSLLSIGSAAGVALMGQSNGQYTFLSHLKWSWAILLGYFCAIGAHMILNNALFNAHV